MSGGYSGKSRWIALAAAAVIPALIVAGLAGASMMKKWNAARADFDARVTSPEIGGCTLDARSVELTKESRIVLFIALHPRFMGRIHYVCGEATDTNFISYDYRYEESTEEWLPVRKTVSRGKTGDVPDDGEQDYIQPGTAR